MNTRNGAYDSGTYRSDGAGRVGNAVREGAEGVGDVTKGAVDGVGDVVRALAGVLRTWATASRNATR